jgi:hypothetical protein
MKKILLTSIAFGNLTLGSMGFAETTMTQPTAPTYPSTSQPSVQRPSQSSFEQQTPTQNTSIQWQPYSYKENNFSVSLPSAPQHTHQELSLPNSQLKIPYDIYVSDPTDKTSYLVGVAQYPTEVNVSVPENNLKAAVNGTLGSTPGGKLISSEMTTVTNFPAIDFSIEGVNYHMKGRYILVGHTLYQLMLAYDKNINVDKDYSTFVDSFKITK